MNMTLTDYEAREFARCAQAMYARGRNDLGHLLSATAAIRTVTVERFDRAADAYRAWLVFDEAEGR